MIDNWKRANVSSPSAMLCLQHEVVKLAMSTEAETVSVANYNAPPCWKKRVAGSFIVALAATATIFQLFFN